MTTMLESGETASHSQIAELRQVFAKFHPVLQTSRDVKGNEDTELVITAHELGAVMRKLGQDVLANELADMIEDTDGELKGHGTPDGALDFPEFLHMMSKKLNNPENKSELQDAFRVFDTDGSGYISAQELCNVMNNLGIDMPNEDGTPMSEVEVADLICDWGPPNREGKRERKPGMSWDRFWSEIQSGAGGLGKKKKKKGRGKLAEEADKLLKKAQVELRQATESAQALDGRRVDGSAEEFQKRQSEAQDAVTAAQQKIEELKAQFSADAEVQVTRLDIMRFAAQDNLSMHEAVRFGVGGAEKIEKTMRTRSFLGTQFLTADAAQMARRFSIRLAAEAGMDKSGAIDLGEIKGALQEFDRYGDQSVFAQELGLVCEVLNRRPMKNTVNSQVEVLRDTKLDPDAPWSCVGTPPWTSGAEGCRCIRASKSTGLTPDRSVPFDGCKHDANNITISIGSDACAPNPNAKHEKHTSECLQGRESWSEFCARRAGIHGYASSSDARRQRLSWTSGRVTGSNCAFCCVNIKPGARAHEWTKSPDGNRWVEPPERDEVHERMEEPHDPAGLWSHIFPCGAEWRAGSGFPHTIDALCEECETTHARYDLTQQAKTQERLDCKTAVEQLQDEQLQHHDNSGDGEVRIQEAQKAKSIAETRVHATEKAKEESRMRWCEKCAHAHRIRFAEGRKHVEWVEDVESKIEQRMAKFMRPRKPQKLLQEIRRAALVLCSKSHHGEIRDRLLRRRVLEENKTGFTPIHCAARDGALECVHALLVHRSTAGSNSETLVPSGKSVAYTWEPSVGTTPHVDPPQDADRRPGLRHPDYDVWPTKTSLPPKTVWLGTQAGQGPEKGRGITAEDIKEIMDSTGVSITVPNGLNTDSEAWKRAEDGPDAASGIEAGPTVIEIEGDCNADLDGCEPPILVARRKLYALGHNCYLDHLRELYAMEVKKEKIHAEAAKGAKDEKQAITDKLVHLERTMRVRQTPKQQEELQKLKAEEHEKELILTEKRLVWNACIDHQRIQAQKIAEVEVDYQMMQPSLFETTKGTIALLATRDLLGFTPLHWACRNGHTAVALALIVAGAHPTALSLKGRTPLEEAEAFAMNELSEGEELAKLNQTSVETEVGALRQAEKQRRDCVAELRERCPLMADEPLDSGTQIIVDGYGRGEYVGCKKKASSGFCGRGALCALHTVRFESNDEEQHLHLKEMGWRLPAFSIQGHSAKASRSSKTGPSVDASFDGLEKSAKQTSEPEPPLPGGMPETPSKYRAGTAREGKKLGV